MAAPPPKSLDPLASIARGTREALDYLLAGQGGACAAAGRTARIDAVGGGKTDISSLNKPVR